MRTLQTQATLRNLKHAREHFGQPKIVSFSHVTDLVYTVQSIECKIPMIDLTVVLSAKDPASLPELRRLLALQVNLSRKEPGCIRFEAFESQSVAGTFILIERWESQAALDVHRTAEGFTTVYAPQVLPLVERVAHVCNTLPGT